MKNRYLIVGYIFSICLTSNCNSVSQKKPANDIRSEIKNIENMPYIPELSGDQIYWELVKKKLDVVPSLIELLNDSSSTEAIVPNFGGFYTVGDIAYFVIAEIIHDVPTTSFVPYKSESGGFHYYWEFVRKNYNNRMLFQKNVLKWYKKNEDNLIWVDDSIKYRTSSDWKYPGPYHPSGGHYRVKN